MRGGSLSAYDKMASLPLDWLHDIKSLLYPEELRSRTGLRHMTECVMFDPFADLCKDEP